MKTETIIKPANVIDLSENLTGFWFSSKCRSGESKSINNYDYQRSLNTAHSVS